MFSQPVVSLINLKRVKMQFVSAAFWTINYFQSLRNFKDFWCKFTAKSFWYSAVNHPSHVSLNQSLNCHVSGRLASSLVYIVEVHKNENFQPFSKTFDFRTKHIQWHHPSFANSSWFPLSIFAAFGHENLRGAQWIQSLFSSMCSADCVFSCLINAAFLRQVGDEICISGSTLFSFILRFLLGNSPLEELVSFVALLWNVLLGTEPIIY